MKRYYKFILIIVAVLELAMICSSADNSDQNPSEQIVTELAHRRVVMIADFTHEYSLSYHIVISTLTNWLLMAEKGELNQNHLTLFIEESKKTARFIKQYLKTGNIDSLLGFNLPSLSIERLEFYSDLRRIVVRIDSINLLLPTSKHFLFEIEGPEESDVFDTGMMDSSARWGILYFMKQRDSLIANNMIKYLKEHPDRKALVFYGFQHLIGNIVAKTEFAADLGLSNDELMGAYLAYYLKREYGKDQVLTIGQIVRGRSQRKLDTPDGTDHLILSSAAPWKDSVEALEVFKPQNIDTYLILDTYAVPPHPLLYVSSRKIVAAALKRMEELEPHRKGNFGNRFYQEALKSLSFHSDTSFESVLDWKKWFSEHPLLGLDRLQSKDFQNHLKDYCLQALGTSTYIKRIDELVQLGFDTRVISIPLSREKWEKNIEDSWQQIIFINTIGIYWVGDDQEKSVAKQYLVTASGIEYDDPASYMKWWRHRYYGVNY